MTESLNGVNANANGFHDTDAGGTCVLPPTRKKWGGWGDRHSQVLSALAGGLTDPELAQFLEITPSNARWRRIELQAKGLVGDSGTVRKTSHGRAATVWALTDAGRRELETRGRDDGGAEDHPTPPPPFEGTTMTTKTKKTDHKKAAVLASLNGMKLLGSLVNWNDSRNHGRKNSFSEVVKALGDNGLDAKVAKEFLPKSAFSRACNRLREDRVIDSLQEDADHILFQFSKQHVKEDLAEGGTEVEWRKEVKVLLDKTTGVLECKDEVIKKQAQDLLDRCLKERTTSDVSNIINKLFEQEAYRPEPEHQADLIRVGEGMFFVPAKAAPFLDRIQGFMTQLGRHINRFPVPAGDQHGDRSVQESMAAHFEGLISDLRGSVKGFTVHTRQDTLEQACERINAAKVKIEAYADYLQDKQAELLKAVAEADQELIAQVDRLDEERKLAPPKASANGQGKTHLYGQSVASIVRWMGSSGWDLDRARAALESQGVHLKDSVIKWELAWEARWDGDRDGVTADLTPEQVAELEALAK